MLSRIWTKTRRGLSRPGSPAPCPQIESSGQPAEHQGPSGSAVATRALDTPQNAPTGSAMGSAAPCGSLQDDDALRPSQSLQCGAGHARGRCSGLRPVRSVPARAPHPPLVPPGCPRSESPSLDPIDRPNALPDDDGPQPFDALDSASTRSRPCCRPGHPSSCDHHARHFVLSAAGTPSGDLLQRAHRRLSRQREPSTHDRLSPTLGAVRNLDRLPHPRRAAAVNVR